MEITKTIDEIDKLIREYNEIKTIIENKKNLTLLISNNGGSYESNINYQFIYQDYQKLFVDEGIKKLTERKNEILNILEENNIIENEIKPLL